MAAKSKNTKILRKRTSSISTPDGGPRTVEEFLSSGRTITRCAPGLPHDLLKWEMLGERILGASYDDLSTPTSRWYISAQTQAAIHEASSATLPEEWDD